MFKDIKAVEILTYFHFYIVQSLPFVLDYNFKENMNYACFIKNCMLKAYVSAWNVVKGENFF